MADRLDRKPFRVIGFWSGLAAGIVLPLLLAGGVASFLALKNDPPRYLAVVRSSGAALTARGGARVVFSEYYETLTQDCRGACDNVEVDSKVAPYGYQANVLDAHGNCIACEWGPSLAQDSRVNSTLVGGGIVQTTRP